MDNLSINYIKNNIKGNSYSIEQKAIQTPNDEPTEKNNNKTHKNNLMIYNKYGKIILQIVI